MRKKQSYVKHLPDNKNSNGDNAPWVIISHKNGKVLSSHKTEEAAKNQLKNMQGHAGKAANFKWFKDVDALIQSNSHV